MSNDDQEMAMILKLMRRANVRVRVGDKIKVEDKLTGKEVGGIELKVRLA